MPSTSSILLALVFLAPALAEPLRVFTGPSPPQFYGPNPPHRFYGIGGMLGGPAMPQPSSQVVAPVPPSPTPSPPPHVVGYLASRDLTRDGLLARDIGGLAARAGVLGPISHTYSARPGGHRTRELAAYKMARAIARSLEELD